MPVCGTGQRAQRLDLLLSTVPRMPMTLSGRATAPASVNGKCCAKDGYPTVLRCFRRNKSTGRSDVHSTWLADRDLCWVHQNSIHIGWNTSLERVIFVELAHDMHAAGLIRYEKGSRISTKGCLNTEQEIALWCEWVCDSVLSDLIEKAANWKVTRHTLLFRGGWITSITGFNQGYEMPQNIAPACSKPTMDCYSFGG